MSGGPYAALAALGAATVYEAGGRRGYVNADLVQVIAGSRAAGPARTVRCAQDDNLMVHAVMAEVQPGEVLVLTMPEPRPVALIGELLATQARAQGAAAILVDGSVRDIEELAQIGLPIWARWVRVRGATKERPGEIGSEVTVGGAAIRAGDAIVLDADGVAVVESERVDEILAASHQRAERGHLKRAKLQAGALSYDLDGLPGGRDRSRRPRHRLARGRSRPRSRPRVHRPRRAPAELYLLRDRTLPAARAPAPGAQERSPALHRARGGGHAPGPRQPAGPATSPPAAPSPPTLSGSAARVEGDHRDPFHLRPGERAGGLDPGRARPRPGLGGPDHRDLPHLRDARRERDRRRAAHPPDEPDLRVSDCEAIRGLVENWALWRDAGDWERFAIY